LDRLSEPLGLEIVTDEKKKRGLPGQTEPSAQSAPRSLPNTSRVNRVMHDLHELLRRPVHLVEIARHLLGNSQGALVPTGTVLKPFDRLCDAHTWMGEWPERRPRPRQLVCRPTEG
jgi:hypothetical protein